MPTFTTTKLRMPIPMKTGAKTEHESVLLDEVLADLDLKDGLTVVDATVGRGGHSEAILRAANVRVIAIDADGASIESSNKRLAQYGERVQVIEGNFRDLHITLAARDITTVDRVLFDLGWNRTQLAAGRGFSFQHDDTLDMSYGSEPVSGFRASDILNTWSESSIADVLFGYGEERYARRIAASIVDTRTTHPITTTGQLVDIIMRAVPAAYRHGRTHAATKTFQALRIAVNDEFGSLERGLHAAWDLLTSQGRIAAITFHSQEDRIVKRIFAQYVSVGATLAHKKPIVPTLSERTRNPASRSAKLRTIIKK